MGSSFSCLGDNPEKSIKSVSDVKLPQADNPFITRTFHTESSYLDPVIIQSAIRGYQSRKQLALSLSSKKSARLWRRPETVYTISNTPTSAVQDTTITTLEKSLPLLLLKRPPDGIEVRPRPALLLEDGSIYEGEWDKSGKRHGIGTLLQPDGTKITGVFSSGVLEGFGRLIQKSGFVFEGEFRNGKLNGTGKITGAHGGTFSGDIIDGKLHGVGREQWPDGMKYKGEYKNGLREGQGQLVCSDGSKYQGEFRSDKMHGKGKYLWKNGNKYTGEWVESKMEGKGVFEFIDGRRYEGEFKEDLRCGFGKMVWPDGREYVGEWKDGKQHGYGTYTYFKEGKANSKTGVWEFGARKREH